MKKISIIFIFILTFNLLSPFNSVLATDGVEDNLNEKESDEEFVGDQDDNKEQPSSEEEVDENNNDDLETEEVEKTEDSAITDEESSETTDENRGTDRSDSESSTESEENEDKSIESEKDKVIEEPEESLENNEEDKDVEETEETEETEEIEKYSTEITTFSVKESNTSRLGHLKNNAEIFKELGDSDSKINNASYLNRVYYVKQQATLDGQQYYLISTQPSKSSGTIGWVKSSQINSREHKGVDTQKKIRFIKGSGQAFTKAWGGNKDLVYNLSSYKGEAFIINKTERVGNNTWYRGHLDGKQVFIHEAYVEEATESKTSKLGHLKNNAEIYKELGDSSTKIDNSSYLNGVYYIKQQATAVGEQYYLISTQPSDSQGTIGWVKSSQINHRDHKGVDTQKKVFTVNGKGQAYSKAWGGSKDQVFNLSNYKDQAFVVNKTERVGNNTWYRGYLNGKQVFIHEAFVDEVEETNTSKLGHLKRDADIFTQLGDSRTKVDNSNYLNAVYYIKKQAIIGNEEYYLISIQASSTKGTIGWVKSSQMNTRDHKGVNTQTKAFTVVGKGQAFSKAWGGNKNQVYNLSDYKDQVFAVNKTERVGNNTWYRGHLNGKQVFIHETYVNEVKQTSISKLGHLKSNAEIYKQLGDPNSQIDNAKYLNAVYYIKSQATINGQQYYLISTQASSTKGIIGWVKSSQMNIRDHKGVDTRSKTYFINGNGQAFSKAWGGSKDLVYDLSNYKDQPFQINKTERVGNNTWYRGTLNGKQVFIHEAYLTDNRMVYEDFNVTLNSALNIQMGQLQQTDKYVNSPAFVHQNYVDANNRTTARVNVRAAANTNSHIYGQLNSNSVVSILGSSNNFYQINYQTWRNPTRQDVLDYLDPSNNDIFQHLSLSDSVGVDASSLNNLLVGKGILAGKGQAFIDGAKQHQVNDVYLISHALLETGNGGSALAKGVQVGTNSAGNPVLVTSSNRGSLSDIQTVYNMFGIGAVDGDAHRAGAVRAYREGWNTPEKAITGGAKFIGDNYIHNQYNQDTLYKMRWNPANPGYPQYATDIGWAVKQVSTIKNMYEKLDNPVLRFKVPNYK